MRLMPLPAVLVLGFTALSLQSLSAAPDVEWAGEGQFRLLVTVAPTDIAPRQSDCRPARIDLTSAWCLRRPG